MHMCLVSGSAPKGMPACCPRPCTANRSPLKAERVPLRNGNLVKLSVSSGAWLLLVRSVTVQVLQVWVLVGIK